MSWIQYVLATKDDELEQIISIQKANIRHLHSPEVEQEKGFVTVSHDIDLLKNMNQKAAHILAKDKDRVIGYALAMTRDFKDIIPVLVPMFELLENIEIDGNRIGSANFLIMGQICIDEAYRGQGIFQGMYQKYFKTYKAAYGTIITEVAARNTRSLKAHKNVGFKEIHRYHEEGFEEWVVIQY